MNDKPLIPDDKMHDGHRARMRKKLLKHGPDIFDTYELLEMLLYYSIPYKDTNPVSKRLLMELSDLDGVLSASTERLVEINGIGERTAELIASVDSVGDAVFIERTETDNVFNNYDVTGEYLAGELADTTDKRIVILLLDNGMRKLDLITLYENAEYGSVAVKPKDFINAAIIGGASVAITAHNHPYGPLAASAADLETNKLLERAFKAAGIILLESYVTVGKDYVGTMSSPVSFVYTDSEIDTFRRSREFSQKSGKGENLQSDNA
ncbi:MAG: RadC family protein [Clostridia bacterium]|nr:RadC family protein [Clostridia bacterium]